MNSLTISSSDDVYRRIGNSAYGTSGGGVYNPAGRYDATNWGYGCALRIQLNIPRYSTISSATLTGVSRGSGAGTGCRTRIRAELADNPASFSSSANFDSRIFTSGNPANGVDAAKVTSAVDWDILAAQWTTGTAYASPNIGSVIQQIVNRPGWNANNYIVLFWDDFDNRSTGDGSLRIWNDWEGAPSGGNPVELNVLYDPYNYAPTSADTGTGTEGAPSTAVAIGSRGITSPGDTFVGAANLDLTSHAPTGPQASGSWVRDSSSPVEPMYLDGTGFVRMREDGLVAENTNAIHRLTTAMGTPDYEVAGVLKVIDNKTPYSAGVLGRWNWDSNRGYSVVIAQNGDVVLYRNAPNGASIGTVNVGSLAAGNYPFSLVLQGDQISVKFNGSTVIGPVTDANVTEPGYVGIRITTNTLAGGVRVGALSTTILGAPTGPGYDNATATDAGATTVGVTGQQKSGTESGTATDAGGTSGPVIPIPAPGGGATYGDDMTETTYGGALSAHVPSGPTSGGLGAWSRDTGSTGVALEPVMAVGGTVRAYATTSGGTDALYVQPSTITASSADYAVSADVVVKSMTAGFAGLLGRWVKNGLTGYCAFISNGGFGGQGNVILYRYGGGQGSAQVGSYAIPGFAIGTYNLRLTFSGTTVTVQLNGTTVITATNQTGITAAGSGGLRVSEGAVNATNTTGIHLDNFQIILGAGGAATPVTDSGVGSDSGAVSGAVVQKGAGFSASGPLTPPTPVGSKYVVSDTTDDAAHPWNGVIGFVVAPDGSYVVTHQHSYVETFNPAYGGNPGDGHNSCRVKRLPPGADPTVEANWSVRADFDANLSGGAACSDTNVTVLSHWQGQTNVVFANYTQITPVLNGEANMILHNRFATSTDNGLTWSNPADLSDLVGFPQPGAYYTNPAGYYELCAAPPIEVPDAGAANGKAILLVTYRRTTTNNLDWDYYDQVYRSMDGGYTWSAPVEVFPYVAHRRYDEPYLVLRPDGKLLCFSRTTENTNLTAPDSWMNFWVNWSDDGGYTWNTPQRAMGMGVQPNPTPSGTAWWGLNNSPRISVTAEGMLICLTRANVGDFAGSSDPVYSCSVDGFSWTAWRSAVTGALYDFGTLRKDMGPSMHGQFRSIGPANTPNNLVLIHGTYPQALGYSRVWYQMFSGAAMPTGTDSGTDSGTASDSGSLSVATMALGVGHSLFITDGIGLAGVYSDTPSLTVAHTLTITDTWSPTTTLSDVPNLGVAHHLTVVDHKILPDPVPSAPPAPVATTQRIQLDDLLPANASEEYLARLGFWSAQRKLSGSGDPRTRRNAQVGWYGTSVNAERGSFAVVRADGPLADLVGERVRVTAGNREVFAYVIADADVPDDLALTRRAYMHLELLSREPHLCKIEVVL